ncbi:MAG: hypothetical protein K0S65_3875, partial [Labilithrix sp.]|nr:hypothetical protein [Labilithrix sp.]
MRRHAALPVLMGILGIFGTGPARAADLPCSPTMVEADENVRRLLPDLPPRIREALDARDDIDACARVKLTKHDASIAVEVVLADGRSTSRAVSRREDVVPTLEALLLVPRPPPPLRPAPAPSANEVEVSPAVAEPTSVHVDANDSATLPNRGLRTRWPADPSGHVRFELSVATGARLGDRQKGVGLGLLSFVDIGGWLAGFGGRADYFQRIDGSSMGAALSLAALGGRRFRFRSLALDLTAGPAMALPGSNTYVVEGPQQVRSVIEQDQSVEPRVLLGARLVFRARSALRAFVGVDGDIGLGTANDARVPVGLAGGAAPSDMHR